MTLTAMLAELYRRLRYQTAPASAVTTRLTAFVNDALQELLAEPGIAQWIARHEPPITFVTVANQAVYGLAVPRVDAIVDRTNQRRLAMRSLDWYRSALPDPTQITGTPDVWVPLGFMAVATQPSAATGLWAVSSAGGDTTQTVYVETVRSMAPSSGSLSLNGTTRVQLGSLTDHTEVVKFYLSATCAGAVSLYNAASNGTLLATIPIGQTQARYVAVALYPTPADAVTYTVDAERELPSMANGTDEPPFPSAFHHVLVDGALWREYALTDDSRATLFQQRYARGVAHLRYALTCPPDYLPVAGVRQRVERSRFGAWFPETSS